MWVWDAFWALSTCRSMGFGAVGRIPWTAIERYADRIGVDDPDDFDDFQHLIRALDDVFVEHITSQSRTPDRPNNATARHRRRDR